MKKRGVLVSLLLIVNLLGNSLIASDVILTCTADDKTAMVEFQSTFDGIIWNELGNSSMCEFMADSYGLLVCFRVRALGQTGWASAYTGPACFHENCHTE